MAECTVHKETLSSETLCICTIGMGKDLDTLKLDVSILSPYNAFKSGFHKSKSEGSTTTNKKSWGGGCAADQIIDILGIGRIMRVTELPNFGPRGYHGPKGREARSGLPSFVSISSHPSPGGP